MIYWVFGGTAVGKKRFIRAMVNANPTMQAVFIADGRLAGKDVIAKARAAEGDLLVRWQWRRQHALAETVARLPGQQMIYLLSAIPEVQYRRAERRDGKGKRDIEALRDEAASVRWLALGLAADFGLPLIHIDTSSDSVDEWLAQLRG